MGYKSSETTQLSNDDEGYKTFVINNWEKAVPKTCRRIRIRYFTYPARNFRWRSAIDACWAARFAACAAFFCSLACSRAAFSATLFALRAFFSSLNLRYITSKYLYDKQHYMYEKSSRGFIVPIQAALAGRQERQQERKMGPGPGRHCG